MSFRILYGFLPSTGLFCWGFLVAPPKKNSAPKTLENTLRSRSQLNITFRRKTSCTFAWKQGGDCFVVTLPETNIAPEKWMVGIRSFPFGMQETCGCIWWKEPCSQWFSQVAGCKNTDQPGTHPSPNLSLSQRQNGGKFFFLFASFSLRTAAKRVVRRRPWKSKPSGVVTDQKCPKKTWLLTRQKKIRHPKKSPFSETSSFFVRKRGKAQQSNQTWAFNWKRLFLDTWDDEWKSKILVPH